MEGSLSKWTNVMKGWQYRWFVLDDNSGLLSYYTSKEKMMRGVRRGCVRLKGAVIGIDDEDDSTFTITVDHKTFHFQARDAEEREKWVRALEDAIFRHGSRMKWNNHQPPPTIKDFESKVSEADAYLQLLIEQTRNLEERTASMSDNEEKSMCQCIIEHANSMLDNVKHSIVLLQIAKNTAHPVNGLGLYTKLNTGDAAGADCIVHSNLDFTASCLENGHRHALSIGPAASALIVPDMSYSSSEGEEDFFDANDYPSSASQLPTPMGLKNSFEGEHPETEASKRISRTPSIPSLSKSLQGIDIDAIYEEEDDENLEMECHGSVVRHLLSQVKIGMDLTKVVLPTFILERRSLLEMYADFFAHPDIFLNIVDFKDPKQRMVQVLKWYLSSYHAGKKSAVAKKPYNPVLGEIFRCFWNVPGTTSRRNSTPTNPTGGHAHKTEEHVADGPVPWCTKDQLCFIAEQVSHHPPISAFYGEHFNKRISFNAHIYTKSKFLGLSVCVHNLGEGRISVLDYDEEYIVTFPVGYGRSILTVPWIELGGPATVNCPKTGYHCNIEFITKPFYGNKKHRIVAEAYGPEDNKKPFLTVTGEWNGLMEAKWSDEKETEKFVDVRELDIVKKQVKAVGKQEENESRRLWKEVTAGLKFNNIEKATNAKQYLEQKQRDEAKERSDSGVEWQTKLFQKGPEESWHYKNPLKLRINKPSNS